MKKKQLRPAGSFAEAVKRLAETGRVLSAANEERLRSAVESLNQVLDQIATAEPDDTASIEAKRKLAEAWSTSAWDASCGADLLADLVDLMGAESDEPEQFAMLRTAFDALNQWITAEVGEIGTPDEGEDAAPIFDYEAMRARTVSETLHGDVIPLKEGAVRSDGTVRMKIIQPGWGSSGFYAADVLERDGPKIFETGTKNFWNHPTLTEEVDRPERSLRDLAGQLTTSAVWESDGPEGPGLYADAQVVSEFAQPVNELAPFIGVSIRALGTAHNGTVEGRSGPIIDKLIAAESIDYVTTPGAGGRVLQLFEAARRREPINSIKEAPVEPTDLKVKIKADTTELTEAIEKAVSPLREENARLREAAMLGQAREHVISELAKVEDIPDVTRKRLIESLIKSAPATADGKLDTEKLTASVDSAVKAEADYLADVTGSGRIAGFGAAKAAGAAQAAEAELAQLLQSPGFGLSESEAKVAAKGRS